MKLALIGVGLIGGSFAAALRAAGRLESVVGFDLDSASMAIALERGIIDRVAASVADAVAGADLVVIATPVGTIEHVLDKAGPILGSAAIITDVGSTKSGIIESARRQLGDRFKRFIPGHPIAGGERNGVAFADAALFRGRLFVATPTAETDVGALAAVESLWTTVGARVERLSAEEHDHIFASVSHLPHLLAFALVAQIASEPDAKRKFEHAGAGFRDFTRIAASSPAMWRDICLANRTAIVSELGNLGALLDQLREAIETGNASAIERLLECASRARRGLTADN